MLFHPLDAISKEVTKALPIHRTASPEDVMKYLPMSQVCILFHSLMLLLVSYSCSHTGNRSSSNNMQRVQKKLRGLFPAYTGFLCAHTGAGSSSFDSQNQPGANRKTAVVHL